MKTLTFSSSLLRPVSLRCSALAVGLLLAGTSAPLYAQIAAAPDAGVLPAGTASRVGGLAGGRAGLRTATPRMTPVGLSHATPAQQAFMSKGMYERIGLVEELGEAGARKWALDQGWTELLPREGRLLRQGLDQVYKDAEGLIHVIEAKGGGSPLNRAYGHLQGTPEWAVESAKRVAKSAKASVAERRSAMAVIQAASEGRLRVSVLRTEHVLGEAGATVLKGTKSCTPLAKSLAKQAMSGLKTSVPAMEALAKGTGEGLVEGEAVALRVVGRGTKLVKFAKVAGPVALVFDGGFRIDRGMELADAYAAGELTTEEHEILQATNVTGMAGGWGGAWGGGVAGAELGAWLGPWGGAIGGVVGGVTGYVVGEEVVVVGTTYAVKAIHATGHTIGGAATTAWDATADGLGAAGDAVGSAASVAWVATASGSATAAGACSDAASSAWGWTSDKAGSAWSWIAD